MIQYRFTEDSVIVTDETLTSFTIPQTDERANEVIRLLKLRDARTEAETTRLMELVDPKAYAEAVFSGAGVAVDRFGNATIDGKLVDGTVGSRLATAHKFNDPEKVAEYARFVRRCQANPDPASIRDLLDWLETSDLGILEDGRFVAYKVVNNDYTDCYTSTIDNSVGQTVRMPGGRAAVDSDNRALCSTGLHFCSKGYLSSFGYRTGGEKRVMVLAVDPADVVAVPMDHGRQKGRAVQYEVIDEVDVTEDAVAREWGLVNQHPAIVVPEDEGEEFDNIYGEVASLVGEVSTTEDAVVSPSFFQEAAPATDANANAWAPGFRGKLARWLNGGD